MTRRHLTFACAGERLFATLDQAAGPTGLLIVTGGNELRAGPWGSQARIAAAVAAAGFPVFRFDRRGVGDSAGANTGFTEAGPDIAAALAAFRAEVPALRSVIGYGNCDAASALILAAGSGLSGLVLSNPWTFDPEPLAADPQSAPPMPPSLLRRHYLKRLLNPGAVGRLLTGQVRLGAMARSLAKAVSADGAPGALAQQMAAGLAQFAGPSTILLAENDRTAQAFLSTWDRADRRLRHCPGASHSFAEPAAQAWLLSQILAVLRAAD